MFCPLTIKNIDIEDIDIFPYSYRLWFKRVICIMTLYNAIFNSLQSRKCLDNYHQIRISRWQWEPLCRVFLLAWETMRLREEPLQIIPFSQKHQEGMSWQWECASVCKLLNIYHVAIFFPLFLLRSACVLMKRLVIIPWELGWWLCLKFHRCAT